MAKKILIIIGFVLVVVVITFLVYYVFFRPIKPSVVAPPTQPEAVGKLPVTREVWERMTVEERGRLGLPQTEWPEGVTEIPTVTEVPLEQRIIPEISEVAQGGKTWVNPLLPDKTLGATLASDGQSSVYYNPDNGKFYRTDVSGVKTLLSDQTFYNVKNVIWAPTADRAIIEYPDDFKIMYDFRNQKQYTLPKNWSDFSWSQDASQIVFKANSPYPESRWLAVANPDGTEAKPIEHMGDNADKVIVSWSPNNQVIAFSKTGEARSAFQQSILLIGLHGENFKSIVVDGLGFEPKWSPAGDRIVYSVYNPETGYRPKLYLIEAWGDRIGMNKIDTGLFTWAHKCTFNSNGTTLYCAVPRNLPEGSGAFSELAGYTQDDFYKIDLRSGAVGFLAEPGIGGYDVERVYLSADEKYLYFTDKLSGRLRYLKLK
jgi:hypothetical protein